MKCELCGDAGYDGDPVVEYTGRGFAHLECADNAGWED